MEMKGGRTKINDKEYNLKLKGKSLCGIAFANIHNICYNTLLKYQDDKILIPKSAQVNFFKL